ncbi:YHYH protein [Candidatus Saccharibacteria bacterium]|nr:YHYH protein [Candidatus Saccharibacteria bacterium]
MEPALNEQPETIHQDVSRKQKLKKVLIFVVPAMFIIFVFSITYILLRHNKSDGQNGKDLSINTEKVESDEHHVTTIDYTKLPLGDNKYSSSPKAGYVYSCQTSFNGGGAFQQGPWIDTESGTWDLTRKISVDGDVDWPDAFWNSDSNGEYRSIASADLPHGHRTGTFPIASSDDAYQYDRNPNSIAKQSIKFQVPLNPSRLSSPKCVGGEVGIATTGVLIFSAFDAGGRDAVATEVQDSCQGHPQAGSYYHYHGYSSCFKDDSGDGEHSSLLGYAFDGFGIFGLKGEGGVELSTKDLDECHGHTHVIDWNGESREIYHYHMTQDFPYTVSCYRGEPTVDGLSSGEGGAQSGGTLPQGPNQQGGSAGPKSPAMPPRQ